MIEILEINDVKSPMENYITCMVRYKLNQIVHYFCLVLIKEDSVWKGYCYTDAVVDLIKDDLIQRYNEINQKKIKKAVYKHQEI